jgi:Uma2 family endonuclease
MKTALKIETGQTYTVDEYMALPDDGNRYELIEEELVEMPGPNIKHGKITGLLFGEIRDFLKENPLGTVINNMAFQLNRKNAPLPDLAFVKAERFTNLDESKAFPGAPDLAVEVMSPTDKWSDVSKKVRLYLDNGASMVWIVDPFDLAVNVYKPPRHRQLLLESANLTGEPLIPGFVYPVKNLFL